MEDVLVSYIKSKISITDEELKVILSYFKPVKLKKNELLVTNVHSPKKTFFVVKGCLRIFYINKEGQDSTRYFAFENQFATALHTFITSEPSDELLQAVEDSEVYYITHQDFYHIGHYSSMGKILQNLY